MVFSSVLFLSFFLPASLTCYFLAPARMKNAVLLLFSCLFYAWGAPGFFLLFALSTTVDYFLGRAIGAAADLRRRKAWLIASLVFNLGVLAWFKYANFFVHEVNRTLASLGVKPFAWTAVALPIGISFFTFHKISYVVDIYRKTVTAARNFVDYALYMALFPQLIAGPIIRYHDISDQIERREHGLEKAFDGFSRFLTGLGKKVLVADVMGSTADAVFALKGDTLSTPYAWLGIICYAYQIYFDFSGYSDMAIGLGRIFGFAFLENFDRPYIARTFTEFWRRWHISLSRWMKDYLYIPLGGNRISPARTYLNLWIVFALSGLWHGAAWTFVAWGLYHGLFLVLDRMFWSDLSKRLGAALNTLLTFVLVLFGWVLFRSPDIHAAARYWRRLVDVRYWEAQHHVVRGTLISNLGVTVLLLATLICFAPALPGWERLRARAGGRFNLPARIGLRFAAGMATLLLSLLMLAGSDFSPFIYFRF